NTDYLRARYLRGENGRFLTRDTADGDQSVPLTLHRYIYANANPVNNIDPSGNFGLAELSATIAIIGILSSMAFAAPGQAGSKETALIVHGDPGPSGGLFEMAAETHKRELRSGTFWTTPVKASTDLKVIKETTVNGFITQLLGKSVVYVAYF